MRDVSESLQEKLDAQATTLCACWRIQRRDGAVLGFTDHDRDLAFNGVTFRASTGLSASEIEAGLGFAPGTSDAAGALRDDALTEIDLRNGIYDGAGVESWLVDWSAPDDRVLLDVGAIGEVTRSEHAFVAELRSSAHIFDQQRGSCFQRSCAADFGDERCGVDLNRYRAGGTVVAWTDNVIVADVGAAFENGFFAGGVLSFTGGANAGAMIAVVAHMQSGVRASLSCWNAPAHAPQVGDALSITAGCDKSATTCRDTFANIVNFRGFPHMPGNDRVVNYPGSLAPTMDGGSFFR